LTTLRFMTIDLGKWESRAISKNRTSVVLSAPFPSRAPSLFFYFMHFLEPPGALWGNFVWLGTKIRIIAAWPDDGTGTKFTRSLYLVIRQQKRI
jgi:hypothetical protein